MIKITESEWKLRALVIQYFFDMKYTKQEIIDNFDIHISRIERCMLRFDIKKYNKCKICGTEENLSTGSKGIIDVCKKCMSDKRNVPKKYKGCIKYCFSCSNELDRKKSKIYNDKHYCIDCFEKIKYCKICGEKDNLVVVEINGKMYKKFICKKCYSQKRSKISLLMHQNRTKEERSIIGFKGVEKRKETMNNKTEGELKEISKKISNTLVEYNKTLTPEEKRVSKRKAAETLKNRTEEEKLNRKQKITETWKNKPQEEIDERSRKIYETKIKNGTLNKRPSGFGFKAQELFWYLDDNTLYSPIYATMHTRSIEDRQNDEQLVNVSRVSKTNKARRLDFYLMFNNKYSLCVEFDEKYHKKELKKDLLREAELTEILPNLIILRVREEDYTNYKEKVQKDLLSIIHLLDKGILDWSIIPQYLLPLNNNYNDIEHILKNNIGIGTNLL